MQQFTTFNSSLSQLAENQREMEEMKRTWEDKLKDAHKSYGVN